MTWTKCSFFHRFRPGDKWKECLCFHDKHHLINQNDCRSPDKKEWWKFAASLCTTVQKEGKLALEKMMNGHVFVVLCGFSWESSQSWVFTLIRTMVIWSMWAQLSRKPVLWTTSLKNSFCAKAQHYFSAGKMNWASPSQSESLLLAIADITVQLNQQHGHSSTHHEWHTRDHSFANKKFLSRCP